MQTTIELRSHEVSQLDEMLPILRDMYDEQYYEEGVETVNTIVDGFDTDSMTLECTTEQWKTLLMGLSSGIVKEEQGGMGTLRPMWLTKKIAKRLDAKDAFEEEG